MIKAIALAAGLMLSLGAGAAWAAGDESADKQKGSQADPNTNPGALNTPQTSKEKGHTGPAAGAAAGQDAKKSESGQGGSGTTAEAGESGQGGSGTTAEAGKPNKYAWHVAALNAGLRNGATNAQMLQELSKSTQNYDPTAGRYFVKNVREALNDANQQLSKLEPAAKQDQQKFQDLQNRVKAAQNMLPKIEQSISNPTALNEQAGQLFEQISGTFDPLDSMADTLKADIELKPKD